MVTIEEVMQQRKRVQEDQEKLRNQEIIANTGRLKEQDPILLTLTDIRNFTMRIMQYLSFTEIDGKIKGSRFTIAQTDGIFYIDFLNTTEHSSNTKALSGINIPFRPVYAIALEIEGPGTVKIQTNDPDADIRDATMRINNGGSFSLSSAPSPLPKFTGISIICDSGTSTIVNMGLMT